MTCRVLRGFLPLLAVLTLAPAAWAQVAPPGVPGRALMRGPLPPAFQQPQGAQGAPGVDALLNQNDPINTLRQGSATAAEGGPVAVGPLGDPNRVAGPATAVFGATLFNRAAPSPLDAPNPNYVLSRGDRISVTVWGFVEGNITAAIDNDGNIFVPQVGPVMLAGVRAGDYIAKIDGEEVRGLTLNDAVEKMRGLVNTPIKLTILREGADKPIDITVVRDIIKVKAVKYRVENDVGYMKITSFTEKTYDDLEDAITKIKEQVPADKLKGYVLDLRLNPGGLLDQAVSVSDTFLDRGEIVSTRGRDPKDISRFDARPGDDIDGKPLIVLVNGGSASASEIVAGALQDHRRATVVGTTSFGKGSVQTIIPLSENGALRLTTALYYTPAGKSIQGKGITPDIKVEQPLPEDLQGRDVTRGESDLRGHIKGVEEDDQGSGSAAYVPPDPKDDVQLAYALDLLRGAKTDPAFPPNPEKAVMNQ